MFDEGMAASVVIRSLCAVPERPLLAECRALQTRLHDTRSWFAIWPALDVIARCVAESHTELSARVVGYLDAHVTAFGRSVAVRRHTLDIVRRHEKGGTWMAQGAALDRDALLTHLIERLPGSLRRRQRAPSVRAIQGVQHGPGRGRRRGDRGDAPERSQ